MPRLVALPPIPPEENEKKNILDRNLLRASPLYLLPPELDL